jgi:hypothetical protein
MKTPLPGSIPSLRGTVIPGSNVRINPPTRMTTCAVATAENGPQPKITLIREGNAVRAIRVECTCGEVIQLDCQY